MDDSDLPPSDEAQPLDMDGVLDLHMFPPREVKELVPVWLEECVALGLTEVRIIHGKGIGVLREIVHGILSTHPLVDHYGHSGDRGSWGATVVHLKARGEIE
jgi:DNA-nicking Smr family endonuclease